MQVDQDKLWEVIQGPTCRLSKEDRHNLASLLAPNGLLARALSEIWITTEGLKEAMMKVDFSSENAHVRAMDIQSRIKGMSFLVEQLIETAKEREDEE